MAEHYIHVDRKLMQFYLPSRVVRLRPFLNSSWKKCRSLALIFSRGRGIGLCFKTEPPSRASLQSRTVGWCQGTPNSVTGSPEAQSRKIDQYMGFLNLSNKRYRCRQHRGLYVRIFWSTDCKNDTGRWDDGVVHEESCVRYNPESRPSGG